MILENSGRDKALQTAITADNPIRFQSYQLIPLTRTTSFRLPLLGSLFIWKRPEAIVILREDGKQESLRVSDTTRIIQLSTLFAGILVARLIRRKLRMQP